MDTLQTNSVFPKNGLKVVSPDVIFEKIHPGMANVIMNDDGNGNVDGIKGDYNDARYGEGCDV